MVYLCHNMRHFLSIFSICRIDRHSVLRPFPLFEPLTVEVKFFSQCMETLYQFAIYFYTDRSFLTIMPRSKKYTKLILGYFTFVILMPMSDISITYLFQWSLLW